MRRSIFFGSTSWLSAPLALLVLCASPLAAPDVLFAQDDEFEDEFDDEYEDREREPPRASRQGRRPSRAAEPEDEFGEDDGLDEDDEAPPARGRRDEGSDDGLDDGFDEGETAGDDDAEQDEFSDVEDGRGERAAAPAGQGRGGDLLRDRASAEWRNRRFVLHNSWYGPVGGIHVVDAGGGPSESFRAQLLTDFFFANGFLFPGDDNGHIGGSLSLSWSPWDFLEIYASLQSYANSNAAESPSLFQVLGDTRLGLKAYYEVLPFLTLGGDVQVALLNTVGDIGLVGESTSVGIRLNAAMDLRGLETPVPLIARLNLQYYFDNSSALTNRIERARYDALDPRTRESYENETAHLLSRVERFALGINRTDFFNLAVGLEAPFTVMQDFTISPILEWQLGIPVNRQGYSCLYVEDAFLAGEDDGCLAQQQLSAFPSTLTLGVRVMPPLRGLSLTAAVDIGTTGTSTFVRELAGNAPYDVILGFGYAFDTVPQVRIEEREVERRVEVPAPVPPRGRLVGVVVERGTATPVAGAIVAYPGRDLSGQATDASGRFVSYELEPGEVVVELSHPEYEPGRCAGTIGRRGGDVEVRCELVALPRMGNLAASVRSDQGAPVVGATVQVTGPQSFTATTDASGNFARQGLPPGSYTARIDAEGFLLTQESFEVRARETASPQITVIARPRRSLVSLRAREIIIRRQVNFATDSAEILPDSTALLTEIADTLLRHPEIRRVEIQGHTDSNGDDAHNMDLSQRRADAVRDWLVRAGVEPGRLTAQGYGETRPLVPNITAANRARNRRVQFIIQERD